MPDKDVKTVRGKKKIIDRVSVVVCANATGEHKIPISLIGNPKKTACVMNRKWPTIYMQQKRAWMDQSVYWKWFEEVFVPEVTKKNWKPNFAFNG